MKALKAYVLLLSLLLRLGRLASLRQAGVGISGPQAAWAPTLSLLCLTRVKPEKQEDGDLP